MREPQLWLMVSLAVVVVLTAFPTAYWVCLASRDRRWAAVGAPAAVVFLGAQFALIWLNWP